MKLYDSWGIEEFRKYFRRKASDDRDGGEGFLEINIANIRNFDEILARNAAFFSSSPFQFENVTSLKLNFNENRRVRSMIFATCPNLKLLEIRGIDIKFLDFLNLPVTSFYIRKLIEFQGEYPRTPGIELIWQNFPKFEKFTTIINPRIPINISYMWKRFEDNRMMKAKEQILDKLQENKERMNI